MYEYGQNPFYTYVSDGYVIVEGHGGELTVFSHAGASTTPTPAPVGTVTAQVNTSSDDVFEDSTDSSYDITGAVVSIGSAANALTGFTGLRFNNLAIPRGATITSAHLEIYSPSNQWITLQFNIFAEAVGNSQTFSQTNRPSGRTLTLAKIFHNDNLNWLANTWISLDEIAPVIQEVVNRSDWQPGNSLTVIIRSQLGPWARKMITSFDGNPAFAPKLVVTYQ